MKRRPPRSTLFPYTRSSDLEEGKEDKDKSEPAKKDDAGVKLNRYLFIMAQVNKDLIPKPEFEPLPGDEKPAARSEEHTSNSSHLGISYAVFCLKTKKKQPHT